MYKVPFPEAKIPSQNDTGRCVNDSMYRSEPRHRCSNGQIGGLPGSPWSSSLITKQCRKAEDNPEHRIALSADTRSMLTHKSFKRDHRITDSLRTDSRYVEALEQNLTLFFLHWLIPYGTTQIAQSLHWHLFCDYGMNDYEVEMISSSNKNIPRQKSMSFLQSCLSVIWKGRPL